MNAPSQTPGWDEENTNQLLEFVRQISPDTDANSVMLFRQVLRANRHLKQVAEKHLAATGLSWAKFRMLLELVRHEQNGSDEGMQPSELSARQDISRNTVSALIASLEEEGLISRELHSTDRRKFVIRLTSKGRKVLKSKLASEFLLVTDCFSEFSVSERATLLQLLTRLNSDLAAKIQAP